MDGGGGGGGVSGDGGGVRYMVILKDRVTNLQFMIFGQT